MSIIQINPRSLKNLEQICEVLYCLHPSVLDYFDKKIIDNEIILGEYNMKNPTLEERESLEKIFMSNPIKVNWDENGKPYYTDFVEEPNDEGIPFKKIINMTHSDGEYPEKEFVLKRLLKYLQLDSSEYIPIKINIEVDSSISKKIKKLINYLEKTNCPEQIYLHKREADCDAYFAEGYGLTMNKDQEKKMRELLDSKDPEKLKKLLIKEKLYYY